jgi:beta-ureidopropionase / N-carbamoyl-L-amino-acid hydrolase
MREDARDAAGRVDEQRLWQRHADMAQIGAIPGNGVNRAALSKEDIAARRLLLSWAAKRKFSVSVDPIGNLFVRRAGSDAGAAPIMTAGVSTACMASSQVSKRSKRWTKPASSRAAR